MKAAVRERTAVLSWAIATVWRADRRGAWLSCLLQLGGVVSALGVVYASKLAIDSVASGAQDLSGGFVLGLGLLALAVSLSQLNGVIQQLQQRLLGARVHLHVWDDLMRTTVSVDLKEWQDSEFMDRVERVRSNSLNQPVLLVVALFTLLGSSVSAAGLTIALASLNPLLVPLLLVAGVPAVLISRRVSSLEFEYAVDVNPLLRRQDYLERLMTEREGAAELRAYASAPHLLDRHTRGNGEFYGALSRHVRRRRTWALLAAGVGVVTLSATFALIGYLLVTNRMSVATAGAAAIGARLLSGQLSSVFTAFGALAECGPFLRDLRDFASLHDPSYRDRGRPRALVEKVQLENVRFHYDGRDAPALDGVSIEIPRGQIILLVGENGSGKSTLAKVVAGLYDPDEGTVSWDGDPDIPVKDLRASVDVLFQDYVRYQMTARDNITIARAGEVDEEAVRSAAHQANVAPTIGALPEGYDTTLGLELAEGAELSGGQWQRLATARAFYRGSPVIVLDEPTSALDPRAEWDLLQDVRAVLAGRTALLISHRYSSAHLADYIYLMADGRIVEQGTYADLMALQGGRFAELYRLQASAFTPG